MASGTNQTVLGKAGKISGAIASKLKTEIEKLAQTSTRFSTQYKM